MKSYCLEISGPFACFTRPEMKVERVSYDLITPSAARACFEAILWKPLMRWRIRQIEVLRPIRWINLRRNEVASVVSARNVEIAMRSGAGDLGLYIEDDRQQRAGLFLRDVTYRVHADLHVLPGTAPDNPPIKFQEMFERRVAKGQCVNQPYLGCRELRPAFGGWPTSRPSQPRYPRHGIWGSCCMTWISPIRKTPPRASSVPSWKTAWSMFRPGTASRCADDSAAS